MRIVGVIPARYQSSRFPGKPLVDIHGRPMVARVYDVASEVTAFDDVLVATEDNRIWQVCKELSIPVVMTDSNHKTGTDRIAEVSQEVQADLFVNIQGDEPLLRPDVIEAAIRPFLQLQEEPPYSVSNLMTPIRNVSDVINATVPKVVVNAESRAIYLSRSPIPYPKDQLNITYYKQVCVYAFLPAALNTFKQLPQGPLEMAEGIELLRFLEQGIGVQMIEVDHDTVAVDTPADLEVVRQLWQSSR